MDWDVIVMVVNMGLGLLIGALIVVISRGRKKEMASLHECVQHLTKEIVECNLHVNQCVTYAQLDEVLTHFTLHDDAKKLIDQSETKIMRVLRNEGDGPCNL